MPVIAWILVIVGREPLSFPKIPSGLGVASSGRIIACSRTMFAILYSLAMFVIDFFKSPLRLEAENLFLRHQLSIALRRAPPRLRLRGCDWALMVWLTRLCPSLLGAAHVVQPETILRWHRTGFTTFWRWKSRQPAGRPKIGRELRDLIRRACEPIAFEVQEVMRFECHTNATAARS
jgi:hypothetical protein